jgi:hypothetical protein
MKTSKADVKAAGFPVWCDFCLIRIAPNEEQVAAEGKIYHQRCYLKSKPAQVINFRGGEK